VHFAVIAFLCRATTPRRSAAVWRTISPWSAPAVLLGLTTTVLGWAGVFALFTYIAPILTRITGFSERRYRRSCSSSASARGG